MRETAVTSERLRLARDLHNQEAILASVWKHGGRVFTAAAGEVQCGAVIDRRADDRQAQSDVDAIGKVKRLDRDQSLVVIQAQRRVISCSRAFVEHGVGGVRPRYPPAFGAKRGDHPTPVGRRPAGARRRGLSAHRPDEGAARAAASYMADSLS